MSREKKSELRSWPVHCSTCPTYVNLSLEARGEKGLCPMMRQLRIAANMAELSAELEVLTNSFNRDGKLSVTNFTKGPALRLTLAAYASLLPYRDSADREATECRAYEEGVGPDLINSAEFFGKIADITQRAVEIELAK